MPNKSMFLVSFIFFAMNHFDWHGAKKYDEILEASHPYIYIYIYICYSNIRVISAYVCQLIN
jgi:hypothetical protein